MEIKNILVIGNGFDLAIKRKTSYEDFIKFACQITGFPNESISHSLCDNYTLYGKESFIDQYELFQKNLVLEFINFLVKNSKPCYNAFSSTCSHLFPTTSFTDKAFFIALKNTRKIRVQL